MLRQEKQLQYGVFIKMNEQKQYDQAILLAELKVDMGGMKEDFKGMDKKIDIILANQSSISKNDAVQDEKIKGMEGKMAMLYKVLGTGAVLIAAIIVERIADKI